MANEHLTRHGVGPPLGAMMRQINVQFRARFWMPNGYTHTKEWCWHMHTTTLYIDEPKDGFAQWINLPPPMFSFSAAALTQLRFEGRMFHLVLNANQATDWLPWTETRLWHEAKFMPPLWGVDEKNVVRPWSLRWRTLNADHDIMSVIKDTLDCIEVDIGANHTAQCHIQQLRREIVMNALGAPMPHRSHHG